MAKQENSPHTDPEEIERLIGRGAETSIVARDLGRGGLEPSEEQGQASLRKLPRFVVKPRAMGRRRRLDYVHISELMERLEDGLHR